MDVLIIYPENRKQLIALKAVMKAMKVSFEQKPVDYPQHVLNGVNDSVKQADEKSLTPYIGVKDMLDLA